MGVWGGGGAKTHLAEKRSVRRTTLGDTSINDDNDDNDDAKFSNKCQQRNLSRGTLHGEI